MRLFGLLLVIVVFGMSPAKAGAAPPFELPDGDMQRPIPKGQPNIPWTSFEALTLSAYGGMIYHSCGHESMDDGDHAFSWSREKLMRVFRASCLAGIDPKEQFPFGKGWNRGKYLRR